MPLCPLFRLQCYLLEQVVSVENMLYDMNNLEDTKKAFALLEMRSRIMETDIDRGLDWRCGDGTFLDEEECEGICCEEAGETLSTSPA